MMPIDCASRCSSGSSIADRPEPPRRPVPAVPAAAAGAAPECGAALACRASPAPESTSGQERTAPAGSGEVPTWAAGPGASPVHEGAGCGSSGRPEEPVIRSVVSLTRGPSQGTGAGRRFGHGHPLSRSGRSAGPIVVQSAIPALSCTLLFCTVLSCTTPVCCHALPTPAATPENCGKPRRPDGSAPLRTCPRRAPSAPGGCGGMGMGGSLWQPQPSAGCGPGLVADSRAPLPMAGHLVRHPA